jgi:hypothetical protein
VCCADIGPSCVRSDLTDKPTFEATHKDGKHSESVWGVKWVNKDPNKKDQQLMSISGDSTVQQWSVLTFVTLYSDPAACLSVHGRRDMKKGLVPHELMQLKRIPNKAQFITQMVLFCWSFSVFASVTYLEPSCWRSPVLRLAKWRVSRGKLRVCASTSRSTTARRSRVASYLPYSLFAYCCCLL